MFRKFKKVSMRAENARKMYGSKCLSAMIAIVMIFSMSVMGFAENENEASAVNIKDSEVATEMIEANANGERVTVNIDDEIVDEISGNDLEEILTNGLGVEEDTIEIVSQESLEENGTENIDADSFYVYTDENDLIGVRLSEGIGDEDLDVVSDIISDEPSDGDIVNIEAIETIEQPEEPDNPPEVVAMMNETAESTDSAVFIAENNQEISGDVSTEGVTYYIENGKKKKVGSVYQVKDVFITSVAKGQTIELSKKFTASISCSLEAGASFDVAQAKAGMKGSITCTIAKKTKFSSAGLKKGCNSREFRVKFYKQKYKRTQYKKQRVTHKLLGTKSATFGVPEKFARYSIDKKVK